MAGYSGTPLIKKLGIQPTSAVMVVNQPPGYFDLLETDISDQYVTKNQTPDLIHLFVRNNKEFETAMKKIKPICKKNTAITIWISWYKKSSKIPTDITEDIIRNY